MSFPVLLHEASRGYPLVLPLRAGPRHPGNGVAGRRRGLFWRLTRALPAVRLILRAGVGDAIGWARKAVTERKRADWLERARWQFVQTQPQARLFDDVYDAASTWDAPRRLVRKAEWLPNGLHPRCVLTNLALLPQARYDTVYVQRGADSEQRIKALKLGLQADHLSCRPFMANPLRLLFAQAASRRRRALRQATTGTQFATAQVERLRTMLRQGVARVRLSTRRGLVE